MSGLYVDDLDAAFNAILWNLMVVGGGVLLASLLIAWLVNRDIATSLGRLKRAMEQSREGRTRHRDPRHGAA
jgi:hypothetical protein